MHGLGEARDLSFRFELARQIGLDARETKVLRSLSTPERIQDFLTAMPTNFEPHGETCHSVRAALRENVCHCIEGAFIAAAARLLHGHKALLLDFQAHCDDDHVCALFRRDACWGAMSKSNSLWLRWRDPVYRSLRELAMSCFHEYVRENRKTLRRISARPFNIGAYDPGYWITGEQCWSMADEIDDAPHVDLITPVQARKLRRRDHLELRADQLKDMKPPHRKA
jgi:hypothetical protein